MRNPGRDDLPDRNGHLGRLQTAAPARHAASALEIQAAAVSRQRRGYPLSRESVPEDISVRQLMVHYWRIFERRRWLVVVVAGTVILLGTIYTLSQRRLFTATARLQINAQSAQVLEGDAVSSDRVRDVLDLRTLHELLKSRSLAGRVVSQLNLAEDESFFAAHQRSYTTRLALLFGQSRHALTNFTVAEREDHAVRIIMAQQEVRPFPGSRLVDVTITDPEPRRAAEIANAYAQAFIALNRDRSSADKTYAKSFLQEQLQQLRLRLKESERTLLEFAQKEQILNVKDKGSNAESNLASANAVLGQLVSERMKSEQQWRQAERATAIDIPQFLTNNVIDALRARRNALVTEYQGKLETFKPSYPAMVQIKNRISEINRQLNIEVETIRNAFKAAYESTVLQEGDMRDRIQKLRGVVLDLQKRSIQYNILKREADTNRKLYNDLLRRHKEVDVAAKVGASNVFVVDEAKPPDRSSSPDVLRGIALATALGIVLGYGFAYLLGLLDDRIRSSEDIEQQFGLQVVGVVPYARGCAVDNDLMNARSDVSDAYRSMAARLLLSRVHGLPKTLCISSCNPGEGKSTTALAVARHWALMGLKVLLVDADLRQPSLHSKLDLSNSEGLSDFLIGDRIPQEILRATDLPTLAFMSSGAAALNSTELLASPRFSALLSHGSRVFDAIIVDGPPVMGCADAHFLATCCDATLLVISAQQTTASTVRLALQRLRLAKTAFAGVAITKSDPVNTASAERAGYADRSGTRNARAQASLVAHAGQRAPSSLKNGVT